MMSILLRAAFYVGFELESACSRPISMKCLNAVMGCNTYGSSFQQPRYRRPVLFAGHLTTARVLDDTTSMVRVEAYWFVM